MSPLLEFKKRFPDMYQDYKRRCEAGEIRLCRPYLYRRVVPPWILNFPTKDNWRSVTRLHDITDGMSYLEAHYQEWEIESMAVPPLGCGQGQLEWRVVGPTLYRHLSRLGIPVELYAPFGTPHEELHPVYLGELSPAHITPTAPRINPAWVALVDVLHRIEQEPYHRSIGLVTFRRLRTSPRGLGSQPVSNIERVVMARTARR